MNRVFLSYATEDQPFAARLKGALSAHGAETIDPTEDLRPGEEVSTAILKLLRRADLLVFVVPRFEGQGKSALVELGAAKAMGKRIVSVLPDRARSANSDVAMALSETRYVGNDRDLNDWADRVLSELKAA
jgi:nucleoside 2-deoxyribosyltransferase